MALVRGKPRRKPYIDKSDRNKTDLLQKSVPELCGRKPNKRMARYSVSMGVVFSRASGLGSAIFLVNQKSDVEVMGAPAAGRFTARACFRFQHTDIRSW